MACNIKRGVKCDLIGGRIGRCSGMPCRECSRPQTLNASGASTRSTSAKSRNGQARATQVIQGSRVPNASQPFVQVVQFLFFCGHDSVVLSVIFCGHDRRIFKPTPGAHQLVWMRQGGTASRQLLLALCRACESPAPSASGASPPGYSPLLLCSLISLYALAAWLHSTLVLPGSLPPRRLQGIFLGESVVRWWRGKTLDAR